MMATLQSQIVPKRPRLSLKINTCEVSATIRTGLGLTDATALNTLSNKYALATPGEPLPSFALTPKTPVPGIATPHVAAFPETPSSPPRQQLDMVGTSPTATLPMSARVMEDEGSDGMSDLSDPSRTPQSSPPVCSPLEPRFSRHFLTSAPYHHPRSLHSILRNSPLPPRTAAAPPSPRRQSLRYRERAAKKVGYNNPLTQDIVNNQYVKSHIDLLIEEASPTAPIMSEPEASSGEVGAVRKRRKEKKRRWVWTIGVREEDEENDKVAYLGRMGNETPMDIHMEADR